MVVKQYPRRFFKQDDVISDAVKLLVWQLMVFPLQLSFINTTVICRLFPTMQMDSSVSQMSFHICLPINEYVLCRSETKKRMNE